SHPRLQCPGLRRLPSAEQPVCCRAPPLTCAAILPASLLSGAARLPLPAPSSTGRALSATPPPPHSPPASPSRTRVSSPASRSVVLRPPHPGLPAAVTGSG